MTTTNRYLTKTIAKINRVIRYFKQVNNKKIMFRDICRENNIHYSDCKIILSFLVSNDILKKNKTVTQITYSLKNG